MTRSLDIVNDMLDEVVKKKLYPYMPTNVWVGAIYLPQCGKYLVETDIDGGSRTFLSFYDGNNPEEFLRVQTTRIGEMFACTTQAYLNGDRIEWTS